MQGQGPHFPPTRKATSHIHRGEGGKGVKMGTLHWGGMGGGLAKPGSYTLYSCFLQLFIYSLYTCGLELGMCVLGGALFPPKNESTTWNACTPQVLTFFWKICVFLLPLTCIFCQPSHGLGHMECVDMECVKFCG